jgi:hypothetical protein
MEKAAQQRLNTHIDEYQRTLRKGLQPVLEDVVQGSVCAFFKRVQCSASEFPKV